MPECVYKCEFTGQSYFTGLVLTLLLKGLGLLRWCLVSRASRFDLLPASARALWMWSLTVPGQKLWLHAVRRVDLKDWNGWKRLHSWCYISKFVQSDSHPLAQSDCAFHVTILRRSNSSEWWYPGWHYSSNSLPSWTGRMVGCQTTLLKTSFSHCVAFCTHQKCLNLRSLHLCRLGWSAGPRMP